MLYVSDNVPLMACHVAKFHGVTPSNPKVIWVNMLNYKPIFEPPLKNFFGEPPSPVGCSLARPGHFIARVKISGGSTP